MKLLLLAATLTLVSCKPDPIEACVEAEKKNEILICDEASKLWDNGRKCSPDVIKDLITISEPKWRKECMRAMAGKKD